MKNQILSKIEELKDEFYAVAGIRFEKKERVIGEEITDNSKELVDDREFPEYGTPEYNELPEIDGISTYLVADLENDTIEDLNKLIEDIKKTSEKVYLIAGDDNGMGLDANEQIIGNGIVIDILK